MKYLHASLDELEPQTILKPKDNYIEHWGKTDFYSVLEKYRPPGMLAHHEAVFMCSSAEDLDNCIGGEYIFEVVPAGRVEKHDINWSSEVSMLVCDNANEDKIKEAALNYWHGVEHPNEALWEYLTPQATIIKVYPYDDYEDESEKVVKKLKMK